METTNKGKIVGVGKIGTNPSTTIKINVLLINDLKHSLLNIYQLCDKGHLSNKRILMFVYFLLFLPMIVNFLLSFDVCFLLEF